VAVHAGVGYVEASRPAEWCGAGLQSCLELRLPWSAGLYR